MDSLKIQEIYLALTMCFLLVIYYLTRHRLLWKWPIIRIPSWVLLDLHQIHHQLVELLQRKNGTFFLKGPWFANMDMLLTVDPANIQYITSTNFLNYPKGPQYRKIFDFMGDAIFNSDGDLWRFHQRIINSHMNNQDFMSNTVMIINGKVENGLVKLLEHASKNGLILDMQNVFQRFTLDVSCILTASYDPMSLSIDFPEVPLSGALYDVADTGLHRLALPEIIWKMQSLLWLGQERKLSRARKVIDHFIFSIISKKQQELHNKTIASSKKSEGVDFLTSYMKVVENQGVDINNDKFLRDSVLHLLLAAQSTTAATLTWFLWLIARNPEVQEKIREELRASKPTTEGYKWHLFQADETNKLVYLHAALCETLRLYPPAPFQYKSPTQPDVLPSGHHVNPRTKIVFPLFAMARMNAIWGKNCSKFEPERWISEQGKIKQEPAYKFFTFYAGPRICPGKKIVLTKMKMVAATLIHNYQFQVLEDHNIRIKSSVLLHMSQGLKVKVQKRWT